VMYAGHIVESAPVEQLYYQPLHPYSLGLLDSVARLDRERKARLNPISGQPPSLIRVPPGCPFHPRCVFARSRCVDEYPICCPGRARPSIRQPVTSPATCPLLTIPE
jgi:oligopeptide transport system ATP-binding protein